MDVAAYASLLSLMQSLDRIQQLHSHGQIVVPEKQQVLRLLGICQSLVCILEKPLKLTSEMEDLIGKISVVAVEAEMALDKEVVDQLLSLHGGDGSSSDCQPLITKFMKSPDGDLSLHSDLDSVVREIESIDEKLKKLSSVFGSQKIVEKIEEAPEQDASTPLPPTNSTVVGFEDRTRWMFDKLTDDEKSLRAIPIVGMGGIGKTTLARSLYDHPSIRRRFDKVIWCTLSQNFDVKRILENLLRQLKGDYDGDIPDMGQRLYQTLHGRRYLIILDDMWEVSAWESLKLYLPNNQKGSRVIVTTRNKDVAESCGESPCVLSLLDHDKSWDLLREKVFGESSCPEELQEIGRRIAKSCGGLPLSLATISGVLSNSDITADYWRDIAKNVKGMVSSTDDDHCLKVLSLSYHFLPIHLKPCFLQLSKFREDMDIETEDLFSDWVDEGFVKPVMGKEIEDVANEYLNDLVRRNLVLVHRRNYMGDIEICGIHDLVRELSIAELKKVKFYSIPRNGDKFVCHHKESNGVEFEFINLQEVESSNVTRIRFCKECKMKYPIDKLRLVSFCDEKYPTSSRSLDVFLDPEKSLSTMNIPYLWNLHYFRCWTSHEINNESRTFLSEIWEMPQIRHLEVFSILFPDPPVVSSSIILNQLQKLIAVDPKLTDEFINRIPNLKSLEIYHTFFDGPLNVLQGFTLLESFAFHGYYSDLTKLNIRFPSSLKELSLAMVDMSWDDMMASIGSLPNLQVLKLAYVNLPNREREWRMKEGGFLSLKVLVLISTGLKMWRAGNEELPAMESLVIEEEEFLEIPSDIGFIDTLNSIRVSDCEPPTFESARRVAAEQYQCGNEILKVYIDDQFVHMEDDGADDMKPVM